MKRFLNLDQAGFALIIELVVVAIVLLGIGGVGYATYKARRPSPAPPLTTQTAKGALSIRAYCGRLNYSEPCASSVRIEEQSSGRGNLEPYTPTDTTGHLSVVLAAGKYYLTPEPKTDYPEFTPPLSNPVTITAGQTTEVNINYHDLTK